MYERFSDRARKVMQLANEEAQRLNHEYVGTEHILLGILREGEECSAEGNEASKILVPLGMDLEKMRFRVEQIVQAGPDMVTMEKLLQTPRAKQAVEYAAEEAATLGHNAVNPAHLLLGLLREPEGVAAQCIMNEGFTDLEFLRYKVLKGIPGATPDKNPCHADADALQCQQGIKQMKEWAGFPDITNIEFMIWFKQYLEAARTLDPYPARLQHADATPAEAQRMLETQ